MSCLSNISCFFACFYSPQYNQAVSSLFYWLWNVSPHNPSLWTQTQYYIKCLEYKYVTTKIDVLLLNVECCVYKSGGGNRIHKYIHVFYTRFYFSKLILAFLYHFRPSLNLDSQISNMHYFCSSFIIIFCFWTNF